MRALSLHILDLAINAFDACATLCEIDVEVDKLFTTLLVVDNGKGMNEDTLNNCLKSGFSKKRSSGIGLSLLNDDVLESFGNLSITSKEGKGCKVVAKFGGNLSLEGIGDTIAVLLDENVDIRLSVAINNKYTFDTRQWKRDNCSSIQDAHNIASIKRQINDKIKFLEEQNYEEHSRYNGN